MRALSEAGKYGETCLFLYVSELYNPSNVKEISLLYPRKPTDQYYEYSKYGTAWLDQITWFPNKDELFGLFGGGFHSPQLSQLYTIYISEKKVELMREFPSIHNYDYFEKEGRRSGSYRKAGIYGFSPDGKQMLVRKVTDENTRRFVLVNLETMTLDETLLNNLIHEEISNTYLLP